MLKKRRRNTYRPLVDHFELCFERISCWSMVISDFEVKKSKKQNETA